MADSSHDSSMIDHTNGHTIDLDDHEKHATSETNGQLTNGTAKEEPKQDGETDEDAQQDPSVFQLTIKLPHAPGQTQVMVSSQEQVQDIRQSITDTPHTFQYSCFHLEHKGQRVNDFIELSEVPDIVQEPTLNLVEDPYTEAQARMHVVRVRELIGAAGDRTDLVMGVDAGMSLVDGVELANSKDDGNPVSDYDLHAPGSVSTLMQKPRDPAPKTVKSIALSSWNPPPYHLRMRGHLLYLQITTNEGEQHYITSTVSGFHVNRCTNNKFDPAPRSSPKSFSAHSLINLLSQVSPSFENSFRKLQDYNGQRDPLVSYQLSNYIPSAPWLVSSSSIQQHQPDLTRTQECFLFAGAENAETLRDWNEEFQSTRELPQETVQERIFRDRLTNKLFAEYNEAAVRGAMLVARGEVPPLNPTEARDAQIFVYNNVFYSFGADGVGTFASDGGDEAARVATGKDLQGVKAVNQLDINGIFTAGTVVVDYLGKRIVGQSIVPGIFKQRDPGEHQIDYGGVEGKDVIATMDKFVKPFAELSKEMSVKRHAVWDKEGKKHELEASVETKGLLGTDGRRYILDLYRLTPLDIVWLEQHRGDDQEDSLRYPHRMAGLRRELVESYRIMKLREYIAKEVEKMRAGKTQDATAIGTEKLVNGAADNAEKTEANGDEKLTNGTADAGEEKQSNGQLTNGEKASSSEMQLTNGDSSDEKHEPEDKEQPQQPQQETVDVSAFQFTLNPDVFSGQQPQTDEEKAEWQADEVLVRAVCTYLTSDVIPRMVRDTQEGDVGFPMDGQSLAREMHKRGVNVRYLGVVAQLCDQEEKEKRTPLLGSLCRQEMVSRAFKHFANAQLKKLPPPFAQSCVSHLLNCLLGTELNCSPQVEIDEELRAIYSEVDFSFEKVTPETLKVELKRQVELRYRYKLGDVLVQAGKQLQMLREICLKLGFQVEAKEYQFGKDLPSHQLKTLEAKASSDSLAVPQTNGVHPPSESGKKKKKNKHANHSPDREATDSPTAPPATFHPDNVLNIVPIVKEASPRSLTAESILESGRMCIQQDQKEAGQDLLLQSLSLHEQIYGILHPEVARVYYALSTLYFSLDEKDAAVELAKKAVIVSERTLGIDNAETILAYLNLSLFEHATGNTKTALAYVRHALDLWKIVYGTQHPDSITTLNNAAVMLQTMKLFHDSRIWFEASLDVCESTAGKNAIATATLLFQLAQALALDQDSKSAVAKMRECYTIFKNTLGAENSNTKEAEKWLGNLTQAAVSQAKQAALLQNRKLLFRNGRAPRVGGMPTGSPGQLQGANATTQAPRTEGLDQRSLEELLRYINGETAGPRPTMHQRTNPMRRQKVNSRP